MSEKIYVLKMVLRHQVVLRLLLRGLLVGRGESGRRLCSVMEEDSVLSVCASIRVGFISLKGRL